MTPGDRIAANPAATQDGSAVLSALAVGLIVAIVVTLIAARSIGDSVASAARIDRAQAAAAA